ncbi:hypothetical protein [Asticcacaulis benevestitus]|uniref:Lipoprotein n=1 Tax=Asticcacaulis benevestitus DSM 16100 = ATCC BAA-896 TaxID=1121022 RepID=V4PEP3_9CAUL|nr:hypothetical protein [Asticcacaulis benevestitus]ESQ86556.1 hypothetical protein ABENE_18260 [Asticcacaulis benevestitus DSM 16100 = ATCC BAA-896]
MIRFTPLLCAVLLLAGCDKPAPPNAVPAVVVSLPATQTAFLALPRTGAASDRFCEQFKTYDRFDNWQGKVRDLRVSTLDGTADMAITLGQGIRLEALVRKTDPAYAAVMALRLGQSVTFSSQFQHSNNDSECIYYNGPFGVRLSAIKSI